MDTQPKYYGVASKDEAAVSADLANGLDLNTAKKNLAATANYNARAAGTAEPYTFNSSGAPISASSLTNTNPADLTKPTNDFTDSSAKANANASAITGGIEAKITNGYDDIQKILTKQEVDAKNAKSDANNSLLEKIGLKSSALTDKLAAEQTPEFLAKQKASNDAYSALQQSKQAQANEIDVINKSNMTDAGRNASYNGVANKYALQNANLSVTYDIANRDYQSAINNIDNIAKLKMDAVQPYIDYYSAALSSANIDWTSAEKNILNQKISDYKDLQTDAKDVSDVYAELLKTNPDALAKDPTLGAGLNKQSDKASALQYLVSMGVSLQNPTDEAYKKAQTAKLYSEANPISITANGTVYKKDANGNTIKDVNGKPVVDVSPSSQALSVILGSGKFTKDQVKLVTNAINNGEDPFTVIKNQAKNIMGQTEATTVTKYETAKSALTDLQTALAQYYAAGGKTNIFTGNYEKTINKLGEVRDPKLVDLATQIQAQLQVYRNAVSGTAYSEQEGKDINSIFPGINKTQGLNQAILNGRMKAFDSTIDGTYKTALGSAYDKLKESNAPVNNTDPLNLGLPAGTLANPLGI